MITSRKQLISFVRSMLGEPVITVELTDEQISNVIDNVIQQYTEYATNECEDSVILKIKGKGDYQLPKLITQIIKVSRGQVGSIANFSSNYGSDLVPDVWSNQFFTDNFMGAMIPTVISISNLQSTMDKLFGDEINYYFDPYKKILRVFDDYEGDVLMHYYYMYIPNDAYDLMFDQEWIKRASVAYSKQLWGTVTGKYTATLVGGTQINYADMKSEAENDIQILREELVNKWSAPAPIFIG